jgi:hypothetical protein
MKKVFILFYSENSPVVERKMKPHKNSTPSPAYKYTGPPTVNMGSWTERPKTAVVVKNDEDYIMGFGQADPKSAANENIRSSQLFKVQKTPSFRSTDSVDKTVVSSVPKNSSPALLQVIASVSKQSTVITPGQKGLSATLNARPAPKEINDESPQGSVRSVLSSWKARMQENTQERRSDQGPPPEIDLYGNGSVVEDKPSVTIQRETVKRSDTNAYNTVDVDVNIIEGSRLGERTNSVSSLIQASNNDSAQRSTVQVSEKNVINRVSSAVNRQDSDTRIENMNQKSSTKILEKDTVDVKSVKPPKPILFKMSTLESKPVIHTKTFKNEAQPPPSEDTVDRGSAKETVTKTFSSNSSTDQDCEPSIQEKKKFFQGIKPVESPGKETPLPAVNMKSSIATIQRVFEKRQQQEQSPKQSPVVEQNVFPVSTKQVEKPDTAPKVVHTNSTMPKTFEGMSSAEMVHRVLGKPGGSGLSLDSFRRSPSPISSTTSTLSRTSSSGRGTPSSTSTESPENTIKVISGTRKVAPPPPQSNIQNVGNKAIIIVNGGESKTNNADVSVIRTNSVRNNIFTQNVLVNRSSNQSSSSKDAPTTKIVVNGSSSVGKLTHQFSGEKVILVENRSKVNLNENPAKNLPPKITQVDVKTEMNNKTAVKPKTLSISGVPPPPPPPANLDSPNTRPIVKSKSVTSLSTSQGSKLSTPTSPTSPDPRSEIFDVIKNSNGNFGLKKVNSLKEIRKRIT